MNIIEKLGIKPIRVYKESNHHGLHYYCLSADTQKLEQQRNDLLKDQIELMLLANGRIDSDPNWIGTEGYKMYLRHIKTIENVTKMKWEEIQKL